MNLSNPIRPGSITTDDLHDGAVTSIKTDFSGAPLTYVSGSSLVVATSNDNTPSTTPILTLSTPNTSGIAGATLAFEVAGTTVGLFRASAYGNCMLDAGGSGECIFNYDSGTGGIKFCDGNKNVVMTVTNAGAVSASSLTLTTALSLSSGGTGKTSPALTAGSNISISGSWPDNTIAVDTTPSFVTIDVTPTTNALGIELHGNTATPISPAYLLHDDTGNVSRGALGLSESAGSWSTSAVAGDIVLRADTGTLRLVTAGSDALRVDQTQNVTLVHPLAVTSGGSGTATPALIAGGSITITGAWPNSTVALSSTPDIGDATGSTLWLQSTAQCLKIGNSDVASTEYIGICNAYAEPGFNLSTVIGTGSGSVGSVSGDVLSIGQQGVGTFVTVSSGGHLGVLNNIGVGGKISSYNGLTTAGLGVAAILAVGSVTGVVSNTLNVTLLASPAAGFYRVTAYVRVTAGSAGQLDLFANFNDGFTSTSASMSLVFVSSPTTNDIVSGSVLIYATTGVAITLTGGGVSPYPTIDVAYTLERLS